MIERVKTYVEHRSPHPRIWRYVAQLAGLSEDSLIVDVGCGPGVEAKAALGMTTSRYLGFDCSPDVVRCAHQGVRDPRARFEIADAHALPVAGGSADLVVLMCVLHRLRLKEALREASRVLAPAGTLAVIVVLAEDRENQIEFRMIPELIEVERRRHPERHAIVSSLQRLGLTVQQARFAYMRRRVDRRLVTAIRRRYFSGLDRVSDAAIRAGCDSLLADIRTGKAPREQVATCTVFAARRVPTTPPCSGGRGS